MFAAQGIRYCSRESHTYKGFTAIRRDVLCNERRRSALIDAPILGDSLAFTTPLIRHAKKNGFRNLQVTDVAPSPATVYELQGPHRNTSASLTDHIRTRTVMSRHTDFSLGQDAPRHRAESACGSCGLEPYAKDHRAAFLPPSKASSVTAARAAAQGLPEFEPTMSTKIRAQEVKRKKTSLMAFRLIRNAWSDYLVRAPEWVRKVRIKFNAADGDDEQWDTVLDRIARCGQVSDIPLIFRAHDARARAYILELIDKYDHALRGDTSTAKNSTTIDASSFRQLTLPTDSYGVSTHRNYEALLFARCLSVLGLPLKRSEPLELYKLPRDGAAYRPAPRGAHPISASKVQVPENLTLSHPLLRTKLLTSSINAWARVVTGLAEHEDAIIDAVVHDPAMTARGFISWERIKHIVLHDFHGNRFLRRVPFRGLRLTSTENHTRGGHIFTSGTGTAHGFDVYKGMRFDVYRRDALVKWNVQALSIQQHSRPVPNNAYIDGVVHILLKDMNDLEAGDEIISLKEQDIY
eukprot:GEMP01026560.1.p1 GENE.GEMP01026560.1~~GEMP01026560.1.p1  ORF type:complete len:521 (+),score=139.73 GEMP01026560.1:118-1680(+)